MNARHPTSGVWSVSEIAVCAQDHAWQRWREGESAEAGWAVGGRGGNEARRRAAAGEPPGSWTAVPDWTILRAYRHMAPSLLRSKLLDAVAEIGVKPIRRSTKFEDIVHWVRTDLESAAPAHPRTPEAVAMANYWWRYGR